MKFIDLTHTFDHDMPVYPGDPKPKFEKIADVCEEGYTDYKLCSGMHVGTHIDAPLHMIEGGKKLSEIEIEKFFGRGHLLDARGQDAIEESLLSDKDIGAGDILLIMTGFYKKFREAAFYEEFPEITEGFANKAVSLGVSIVAMDTPSPDRPPFPVHKILLGNEVLIIEGLTNLDQLEGCDEFEVMAIPPKFDVEAAPVRVIARI